jgi:hypothetical protein
MANERINQINQLNNQLKIVDQSANKFAKLQFTADQIAELKVAVQTQQDELEAQLIKPIDAGFSLKELEAFRALDQSKLSPEVAQLLHETLSTQRQIIDNRPPTLAQQLRSFSSEADSYLNPVAYWNNMTVEGKKKVAGNISLGVSSIGLGAMFYALNMEPAVYVQGVALLIHSGLAVRNYHKYRWTKDIPHWR